MVKELNSQRNDALAVVALPLMGSNLSVEGAVVHTEYLKGLASGMKMAVELPEVMLEEQKISLAKAQDTQDLLDQGLPELGDED